MNEVTNNFTVSFRNFAKVHSPFYPTNTRSQVSSSEEAHFSEQHRASSDWFLLKPIFETFPLSQPVSSNPKLYATKVPPSKDLTQVPKASRICLCSVLGGILPRLSSLWWSAPRWALLCKQYFWGANIRQSLGAFWEYFFKKPWGGYIPNLACNFRGFMPS